MTFSRLLALANFDLVTVLPLGCSLSDSTFYTVLTLKTTALPLGPVALLWIWALANPGKGQENAKTAAKLSLLWLEMVLTTCVQHMLI